MSSNGSPSTDASPLDMDAAVATGDQPRKVAKALPQATSTVERDLSDGSTVKRTTTKTTSSETDEDDGHEETPLDLDAAVAQRSVEVERSGPGTGPGWEGKKYMGIEPSYSRVGFLPNTKDVYDRVQAIAGGGTYTFKGKDRHGKPFTLTKTFGGMPLPLPGDDPQGYQAPPGLVVGPDGLLYPSPYGASSQGQSPYGMGAGSPFDQTAFGQQPVFEDQQGFVYGGATQQGASQAGLGYVWVPARRQWQWTGPGARPPGPPPPAPDSAGGFQQYDHSRDGEGGPLADMMKKLLEKMDQPKQDPFQGFLAMQAHALEERRLTYEMERDAREAKRQEERDERIAAAKANADAVIAQANAQKEIAALNAAAMKENAQAAVNSAKEMATMQAANQKLIFDVLLKKTDEGASFDKMFERSLAIADVMMGKKSDIAETAEVVKDVVKEGLPAVTQAISSVVATARGAAPADIPEETKMIGIFGTLLDCCDSGIPPARMPLIILTMCKSNAVDPKRVRDLIIMGGVDTFTKWIDDSAKDKSPEIKQKLENAKGVITSDRGRAWIAEVQKELKETQKQPALPAK